MTKNSTSKMIDYILGATIVGVTLLAIFSPGISIFRTLSEFNVQLVIGLLGLGLFFLIIGRERLLAVSFMCCMLLCVFLKRASNDVLILPKDNGHKQLKISQVNLSSVNADYENLIAALLHESPDIISFQEVTPLWDDLISEDFSELYPYHKTVVRIDPYGMALYSKIPFERVDTFHTQHIPNIRSDIRIDGDLMQLISSYVTPGLNKQSSDLAQIQLNNISSKLQSTPSPVIVLGDYNRVYWTPEMINFKEGNNLNNSRRESSPNPRDIPYEHIFFSNELQCVSFKNLKSEDQAYLGIVGTYQQKEAVLSDSYHIQLSHYPSTKVN